MDSVHELDREGFDILLAVVLTGTVTSRDTLLALDVAYDVARSTGIGTTRRALFEAVERVALLLMGTSTLARGGLTGGESMPLQFGPRRR